jgi:HK97 family phage portal protein
MPAELAVRAISSSLMTATDAPDVLVNSPDGWEVEQPWLWWSGTAGGGRTTLGNPIPGATPWVPFAGIPAVARSTSIIVDTLAALPWKVYRGTEQLPTPDWIADPQALRLDGRIVGGADDTRWSAMDLWSQWILSALWLGDGFLYVPNRDRKGEPVPLLFTLPPDQITLDGGRFWFGSAGTGQEFDEDGPILGRPFAPGEIIHLRGLEPIVQGRGSGVLSRFASTLNYGLTLGEYASGVFGNGVPAGFLKVTQPHLDEKQAQDLKAAWSAAHGGTTRGIAVLNATTDFQALQLSPVDANLVGAGQDFDRHVAQMFGVPAYMLGVPGDSSTYANVESRMIELARFTLLPWAQRVEEVLSAQLPRGTSVKIDLNALMRADTTTRFAAYKTAIDAGFLTLDEVRALEDRPPLAVESVAI